MPILQQSSSLTDLLSSSDEEETRATQLKKDTSSLNPLRSPHRNFVEPEPEEKSGIEDSDKVADVTSSLTDPNHPDNWPATRDWSAGEDITCAVLKPISCSIETQTITPTECESDRSHAVSSMGVFGGRLCTSIHIIYIICMLYV